jgi:hypothetical protein
MPECNLNLKCLICKDWVPVIKSTSSVLNILNNQDEIGYIQFLVCILIFRWLSKPSTKILYSIVSKFLGNVIMSLIQAKPWQSCQI